MSHWSGSRRTHRTTKRTTGGTLGYIISPHRNSVVTMSKTILSGDLCQRTYVQHIHIYLRIIMFVEIKLWTLNMAQAERRTGLIIAADYYIIYNYI